VILKTVHPGGQLVTAENAIEFIGPPLHCCHAFGFVVGPVVDRHYALHRVVQDLLGDMGQHPERVEPGCARAAQVWPRSSASAWCESATQWAR